MRTPGQIFWTTVILLLALVSTAAQDAKQEAKKEAQLRTVHGLVMDKSENPVSESVVYLKNDRNNIVRTLYTDSSGKYRFSGLDPNTDYEIYAQKDDSKSATRTVTSYDSRKDVELNLKIDRKKD
jgi:protocatechuate 3,4-dioxygenase beta subunit